MNTRILIVDDESRVLFVLRNVLEGMKMGYQVVTAQDGAKALVEIRKKPIDLLITDLIMSDMGGIKLTEEVRSLVPDAVVLWITAYGCHKLDGEVERLRVYRCVEKPLEIGQIRQLVHDALSAREREERIREAADT